MSRARILIAGVGNVFLGDDAFGVEVVQRLAKKRFPSEVEIRDFGIRGFDLARALTDGYDEVVIVDAVQRGESPGTLYLLKPELPEAHDSVPGVLQPHSLDPAAVLRFAPQLGPTCEKVRILGCEPADFGSDEAPQMGLTQQVAQAVDKAITMIEELLHQEFPDLFSDRGSS